MTDEIYYSIALTRMTGFNQQMALQLYQALGSSQAVYDHRNDIGDVVPEATPRLRVGRRTAQGCGRDGIRHKEQHPRADYQ